MLIADILIDKRRCNNYRGMDGQQQTVERMQLEEKQDVIDHREFANSVWEQGH